MRGLGRVREVRGALGLCGRVVGMGFGVEGGCRWERGAVADPWMGLRDVWDGCAGIAEVD